MLRPLVNFASRNLSNKTRIDGRLCPTNHLRVHLNDGPKRCMASGHDAKEKGEVVIPVFSTPSDISRTKRSIYRENYDYDPNSNSNGMDDSSIFDREFVDMKVEDFESLYQDDKTGALKSQVETVLKEYEYHKYNSLGCVPSVINSADMERFFAEGLTPSSRERLLNYFFKREMAKRNNALRKQREKDEKQVERDDKFAEWEKIYGEKKRTGLLSANGRIVYGLWHNSMFCRIPENKLRLHDSESRLITAANFGKRLVFDFDFDDYMTTQTSRSVVEQVQDSYGLNRYHSEECFDIWFCNFNEKSKSGQYLSNNAIKNLHSGSMITVKNDCFTNYFDKSRLVYLSPNAKQTLDNPCNNDDVYIIGVYNDKGSVKPLTYRKAESLGIRSRSLPLDMYVAWQGGSKSLCLNHVTGILLEVLSNGGDWRNALLKCVPSRKIKPIELLMEEEAKRLARRKRKFSIRDDFDF